MWFVKKGTQMHEVFAVSYIKLSAAITVTTNGVKIIGSTKLSNQQIKPDDIKFVDSITNEEVPVADLKSCCLQCGQITSISELNYVSGVGSQYCKPCCDEFYSDKNVISMISLMSKQSK